MTSYKSDLLRLLDERGHIYQQTDAAGLDALAAKEPITAYIGFDCTGPCLHVGSLVQIMTLRRLQKTGHKPIVIMGGGTTKIGDPSDKTEARPMLDDELIEANKLSILRIFERFLVFGDGPTDAIMVDNADWLDKLEYIPFLRDVGRHFSINRMLTLDSVKQRLDREQSLSFLEFNYMILQAYDFLELYRRHNCRLQFGGSEQWSNILAGIDVSRRMDGAELYGVTSPLVTTADGAKMGKTVNGAVWLHEDFLPMIIGNSGATHRMPMLDGFCGYSPRLILPKLRGSKICRALRSTKPKRYWLMRQPQWRAAQRPQLFQANQRAKRSKRVQRANNCP
jgi:tyrosyl-tRNA synthetase